MKDESVRLEQESLERKNTEEHRTSMVKEMACSYGEKLEMNLGGHLICIVYKESEKKAKEGTDTIFDVDSFLLLIMLLAHIFR